MVFLIRLRDMHLLLFFEFRKRCNCTLHRRSNASLYNTIENEQGNKRITTRLLSDIVNF